jgi:hypothetical protein
MRFFRSATAVSTVLASVLLGAPAFAATDNLVPTGTYSPICLGSGGTIGDMVCQTDNSEVYYYMDSSGEYELEQGDRDNVAAVLSAQYSPTHLAIHYDSSPVFSGEGETDIVYQEGSTGLPDGVVGATWCNDDVNSAAYECDQTYIRIAGAGPMSDPKVVCHETGHAVGLTHGSEAYPVVSRSDSQLGCLRTPLTAITSNALGTNQVNQINANYPAP